MPYTMCNMYCILGNFCVAKFSLISCIFASLQKYCHDPPFLLALGAGTGGLKYSDAPIPIQISVSADFYQNRLISV